MSQSHASVAEQDCMVDQNNLHSNERSSMARMPGKERSKSTLRRSCRTKMLTSFVLACLGFALCNELSLKQHVCSLLENRARRKATVKHGSGQSVTIDDRPHSRYTIRKNEIQNSRQKRSQFLRGRMTLRFAIPERNGVPQARISLTEAASAQLRLPSAQAAVGGGNASSTSVQSPGMKHFALKRQDIDESAMSFPDLFKDIPFYGYQSQEELEARSKRFPSFDQRVRTYMNGWYVPPCQGYEIQFDWRSGTHGSYIIALESPIAANGSVKNDKRRLFYIHSHIVHPVNQRPAIHQIIFVDADHIKACKSSECVSDTNTVLPTLERLAGEYNANDTDKNTSFVPLFVQYGDSDKGRAYDIISQASPYLPLLPVVKKFRYSYEPEQLSQMTSAKCNDGTNMKYARSSSRQPNIFQPILWKKKVKRHYGTLPAVADADIPWSQKRNVALFRGALTGIHEEVNDHKMQSMPPYERCMMISRCKLVLNNVNSTLVDAMLTSEVIGKIDEVIDGIQIYTPEEMSLVEMLQYKAILMPQGNDVATGLKWAMFSNSVVMLPKPTKTSWPMEELMQPWVHYIPINENFTDVEEKMQWVIDHDYDAQKIAHQGSLWIRDLVIHPDAEEEEQRIYDEIVRRFRKHFVRVPLADDESWQEAIAKVHADHAGAPAIYSRCPAFEAGCLSTE